MSGVWEILLKKSRTAKNLFCVLPYFGHETDTYLRYWTFFYMENIFSQFPILCSNAVRRGAFLEKYLELIRNNTVSKRALLQWFCYYNSVPQYPFQLPPAPAGVPAPMPLLPPLPVCWGGASPTGTQGLPSNWQLQGTTGGAAIQAEGYNLGTELIKIKFHFSVKSQ